MGLYECKTKNQFAGRVYEVGQREKFERLPNNHFVEVPAKAAESVEEKATVIVPEPEKQVVEVPAKATDNKKK